MIIELTEHVSHLTCIQKVLATGRSLGSSESVVTRLWDGRLGY
jgi:hypothetical protein